MIQRCTCQTQWFQNNDGKILGELTKHVCRRFISFDKIYEQGNSIFGSVQKSLNNVFIPSLEKYGSQELLQSLFIFKPASLSQVMQIAQT